MNSLASSPFPAPGTARDVEQGSSLTPRFDGNGLIAAIVTHADSGEVLMLAWMNAEALAQTLATSQAHFYSRSRKQLWRKGEESGNVMDVAELRIDCDQDAVWLKVRVRGEGVACHTHERTCFYRQVSLGSAGPQLPLFRDGAAAKSSVR